MIRRANARALPDPVSTTVAESESAGEIETTVAAVNGPPPAVPVRSTVTDWPFATEAVSDRATGATPVTVIPTAAGRDWPPGPTATKVKASSPR